MSNPPEAIAVLEGLESVRRRPALYVGDLHDGSGLHHLAWVAIDRAIEERDVRTISVTLGGDGALAVEDDGRGIQANLVERTLTILHGGAPLPRVTALSAWLELTVFRDGLELRQRYERGRAVTGITTRGTTERTGTRIAFLPDATIFGDTRFDPHAIDRKLWDVAALNAGLVTRFRGRRFRFEDGGAGLVDAMTGTRTTVQEHAIRCTGSHGDVFVDVAFKWVERGSSLIRSFANREETVEGGTHLAGFRLGLVRALQSAAGGRVKHAIVEDGLIAMIDVRLPDRHGPRVSLTNAEVGPIVASIVERAAVAHFAAHPGLVRRVLERRAPHAPSHPTRTRRNVSASSKRSPRRPTTKRPSSCTPIG